MPTVSSPSKRYLNRGAGKDSIVPLWAVSGAWRTGQTVTLSTLDGTQSWTGSIEAAYNNKKIAFVRLNEQTRPIPTAITYMAPTPDVTVRITIDNVPTTDAIEVDIYNE